MTKPANVSSLAARRRALTAPAAGEPIRTIAVTGGKGGVGKSVICANLAVALAQQSRRVLMFDADLGLANADLLLGLAPRRTLGNVLRENVSLRDAVARGPAGLALVPGASGCSDIANLDASAQLGLISGFSELEADYDTFCVDTGPGINDGVIRIAAATQHIVVVVCDEPTSLADAYAIIKVLHQEQRVDRFRIVTNMARAGDSFAAYEKLRKVAERFLPVVLFHAGAIPYDERVPQSVRARTPLLTAFPRSLAAIALRNLAQRAIGWPGDVARHGSLQFFAESLLRAPEPRGAAIQP